MKKTTCILLTCCVASLSVFAASPVFATEKSQELFVSGEDNRDIFTSQDKAKDNEDEEEEELLIPVFGSVFVSDTSADKEKEAEEDPDASAFTSKSTPNQPVVSNISKAQSITIITSEDGIEEPGFTSTASSGAVSTSTWDGPQLSPMSGTVMGPSGKETYYNLDMSGVISIMRGMGNNDPYWVNENGCKMLGDYIMCAANLGVHPRGSLVESSLGTCIVCDTGGFADYNPYQLDIAVTW
ncbi:MAG: hypothetical protein IKE58_04545 [Blautia sp.]|nr:hypothetical protein [Blautia sp.]